MQKYRILINNTEGEGYICFNQTCNSINNYIHIAEQKIYSFSIFNKTNFFIYAKINLAYNIKIIYEIKNEIKNNNNTWIIILIFALIIVSILLFIIYRKIKIKYGNIEDKIKDIDFSSGINEDLINNQELSDKERKSGSYLNVSL